MLLVASIIALLAGPLLLSLIRRTNPIQAILDGFIMVAISGLLLIDVLPDALVAGGWTTFLFLLLGTFGPTLLERLFHSVHRGMHQATVALALAGILLHSAADGAALTTGSLLPIAVVLHRFPVGLTIWWVLRPSAGISVRWLTLGLISLGTVAGFFQVANLTSSFSPAGLAWFQAFVAGSLLHVVLHRPMGDRHRAGNQWEALGALLALLLLAGLADSHAATTGPILTTLLGLLLESAPALVVAYLLAGLIAEFLPNSSMLWTQKGNLFTQSTRGMIVGLPLPICSCGVVPLFRSLSQRGAPPAAAIAFLVATPELGLDAVLLSFPLLGMPMTLVRVGAAAMVALIVGVLVGRWTRHSPPPPQLNVVQGTGPVTLSTRIRGGLRTGLLDMVDSTAPWILLGICIAALANPLLETSNFGRLSPTLQVAAFSLLGLPTYVCAAGATPLIAVLLANGIAPGAALAFLLTGPATNVTTFGVVGQLYGKRVAGLFCIAMFVLAIILGVGVNAWLPAVGSQASVGHADEAGWLQWSSLAFLLLLVVYSVIRKGVRGFASEVMGSTMGATAHQH